jgi:hypothetical protein
VPSRRICWSKKPITFELVNLTIPPSVLARADEIIE